MKKQEKLMNSPVVIEVFEKFLTASFYKILAIIAVAYLMSLLKQWLRFFLLKKQLEKNKIITEDRKIKIGNIEGIIERIGFTHTKIKTADGFAYIPNSQLVNNLIIEIPMKED